MDPVTAFSVAATVVQFVQFAGAIIKTCKEIRDDVDSATKNNKQLEKAVRELDASRDALKSRKTNNRRISDIAIDCAKIASRLLDVLEHIRGSGQDIGKARVILRTIRSRKQIDELQVELESREHLLDRVLIQDLHSNVQQIKDEMSKQHSMTQKSIQREALATRERVEQVARQLAELHLKATGQRRELARQTHAKLDEAHRTALSNHAAACDWHTDDQLGLIHRHFLDSLFFPDMWSRHRSVVPAHAGTLDWIFDADAYPNRPWSNLGRWLQQPNSSVYWVSGKAGSGKSTLMSHILNDERTKQNLQLWSGAAELEIISFFFWRAGSEMQKSAIGLLHSLLYQLCQKVPGSIDAVMSQLGLTNSSLPLPWAQNMLVRAVVIAISTAKRTRICLFIDGLDEMVGDYDSLVDLIFRLQAFDQIKCCVSSRPEIQLWRRLSGCQNLRLQDLNREDITILAVDKLKEPTLAIDEREWLTEAIVDHAEGVFLWAALVVQTIVKSSRSGSTFEGLQHRLERTPKQLTELFALMVEEIDRDDRETLAFYLHMPDMGVPANIAIITTFRMSLNQSNFPSFVEKCRQTEAQILGQSAGLLVLAHKPFTNCPHFAGPDVDVDAFEVCPAEKQDLPTLCRQQVAHLSQMSNDMLRFESTNILWVHRSAFDFVFPSDGARSPLRLPEFDIRIAERRLIEAAITYTRFAPSFRCFRDCGCDFPISHGVHARLLEVSGSLQGRAAQVVGLLTSIPSVLDSLHKLSSESSLTELDLGRPCPYFSFNSADDTRRCIFWVCCSLLDVSYIVDCKDQLLQELDTSELILAYSNMAGPVPFDLYQGNHHNKRYDRYYEVIQGLWTALDQQHLGKFSTQRVETRRECATPTSAVSGGQALTKLSDEPLKWDEEDPGPAGEAVTLMGAVSRGRVSNKTGGALGRHLMPEYRPRLVMCSRTQSDILDPDYLDALCESFISALTIWSEWRSFSSLQIATHMDIMISFTTLNRLFTPSDRNQDIKLLIQVPLRTISSSFCSRANKTDWREVHALCLPFGLGRARASQWQQKVSTSKNERLQVQLSDHVSRRLFEHCCVGRYMDRVQFYWSNGDAPDFEALKAMIIEDIWADRSLSATQQLFALACVRTQWDLLLSPEY